MSRRPFRIDILTCGSGRAPRDVDVRCVTVFLVTRADHGGDALRSSGWEIGYSDDDDINRIVHSDGRMTKPTRLSLLSESDADVPAPFFAMGAACSIDSSEGMRLHGRLCFGYVGSLAALRSWHGLLMTTRTRRGSAV